MTPVDPPERPGYARRIFAEDQDEYDSLPAQVRADGLVLTAWLPGPEELAAIAAGAPILVSMLTFGWPLQPLRLDVGDKPN